MSELIKDTIDTTKTTKDLYERKQIVNNYMINRFLDRGTIIKMIKELQESDADVLAATTAARLLNGTVILDTADDNTLIDNLNLQIRVLEGKLIAKTVNKAMEDKNEH